MPVMLRGRRFENESLILMNRRLSVARATESGRFEVDARQFAVFSGDGSLS